MDSNYNISKLTLGTVALGMQYGIENTNGMPPKQQRMALMDYVVKNGINTFDTARSYRETEKLIGEFVKTQQVNAALNVVTTVLYPVW